MKRNLKPRVGDYVEVVKGCGGNINVGEQGIVVSDDLGIMFPGTRCPWETDDGRPWLCSAGHVKVIYRPRMGR